MRPVDRPDVSARSSQTGARAARRRASLAIAQLALATLGLVDAGSAAAQQASAPARPPQVVIISVDGAQPDVLEKLFASGALDRNVGLGRLARHGVVARQNVTATPSVTATAHATIATGSTAAHHDIPGNYFHPVGTAITAGLSGFSAPIGGYALAPLGPSPAPTAVPLWVTLREAGKRVVTATWPGSDGADVRLGGAVVQSAAPARTTDYSVPFGVFGGLETRGFALTAVDFAAADPDLVAQLAAAGHVSRSPVRVTAAPLETVYCRPTGGPLGPGPCGHTPAAGRSVRYEIRLAALDTTDDGAANYDTLVAFDAVAGIPPGPFQLPSTGAAVMRRGGPSARFFFEGSGLQVGTAFIASFLAPDLSAVRVARYASKLMQRPPAARAAVEDVNAHVGFWEPGTDYRILSRQIPGFAGFPESELEAIYLDQARAFVAYQTRVALRALAANPTADLVMIYIEQPDGAGHQFTLTDPRQATQPRDPRSVGTPGQPAGATGQDPATVARYARHLAAAYGYANAAVEAIIQAIGLAPTGEPRRDVIVVSDHGMTPVHTAVSLTGLLERAGVPLTQVAVRPAAPSANVYVNLAGREPGGAVSPAEYRALVADVARALTAARDPNPFYNPTGAPLFSLVRARPETCGRPGFCTDGDFGQDSGDVFAQMREGYSFDGIQYDAGGPAPVARLGDAPDATALYSVPGYFGTHGYDSELPSMSAIFYAAGPSFAQGRTLDRVHNVDVAPTALAILGVAPAPTVDGRPIRGALRAPRP